MNDCHLELHIHIGKGRQPSIAKQTGAQFTDKYGHMLIEVEGIRHTRHARLIEESLSDNHALIEVSVSGTGMIRIEFDREKINDEVIFNLLEKENLTIVDKAIPPEYYISEVDKLAGDEEQKADTETEEHKHNTVTNQLKPTL